MKKGKFFKRAALAAAICLSLTQSVWAMPTGGAVVDGGNVTVNDSPFISGDLANGASVVVNAPSIINWSAFGIAAGETLNFNTANGALLNRVTGTLRSDILGTLAQTGREPLFLVNPNGILVGNGSVINATNMVLSTLEVTDEEFLSWGGREFATPESRSIAAPITIRGAKINVLERAADPENGDYFGGQFYALGGTVTVADGVTFSVADNAAVQLAAAKTVQLDGSYPPGQMLISANAENRLSFENSQAGGQGALLALHGGAVNLSNAKIDFSKGGLRVKANSNLPESAWGGTPDLEMLPENAINIQDSNLKGHAFSIMGGKVDITDSNLSAQPLQDDYVAAGGINIVAGHVGAPANDGLDFSKTSENTVTMRGVTLSGENSGAYIGGGKIDIADSNIKFADTTANNEWIDTPVIIMANESLRYGNQPNMYAGHTSYYTLGDASHSVTLTNTIVEAGNKQNLWVAGGKVMLDGATLKGGRNTVVAAVDHASYTEPQSVEESDYGWLEWRGTAETGNTVSVLGGSSISAPNKTAIVGNNVSITEKSIVSADKALTVNSGTAGTMIDYVVDITGTPGEVAVSTDSKLLQNGVDVTDKFATTRLTPAPSPSPSIAPIIPTGKNDQENIANGQAAMSAVLASATSVEELTNATRELVKIINDGSGDERAKAAQVSGVLLAITGSDSIDASEKASLQREVVNTFAPTLNALIAALNLQGK